MGGIWDLHRLLQQLTIQEVICTGYVPSTRSPNDNSTFVWEQWLRNQDHHKIEICSSLNTRRLSSSTHPTQSMRSWEEAHLSRREHRSLIWEIGFSGISRHKQLFIWSLLLPWCYLWPVHHWAITAPTQAAPICVSILHFIFPTARRIISTIWSMLMSCSKAFQFFIAMS